MALASGPPQTASAVARQKILDAITKTDPVPNTLTIGSRVVVISDLVDALVAFRQQKRLLDHTSQAWPSVLLTPSGSGQQSSHWVPIDLRDVDVGPPYDDHALYHDIANGVAQARARARASKGGLATDDLPSSESQRVFSDMLGEIIGKRYDQSSAGPAVSPPSAIFEVTTDSHGVEVIYSDGYFFSTTRGFGYSSPAQKTLPYGTYVFGYNAPTGADFCGGTLWTVPTDSRAHIRV